MQHHFKLFFPNNYDGNKYISFQDLHDPRGANFHKNQISYFYRTYERGVVDVDITMAYIILGYFFPTITMEISIFHFRTSMIQGGIFFKMFD